MRILRYNEYYINYNINNHISLNNLLSNNLSVRPYGQHDNDLLEFTPLSDPYSASRFNYMCPICRTRNMIQNIHISNWNEECPVCFENMDENHTRFIHCGHHFCNNCVNEPPLN